MSIEFLPGDEPGGRPGEERGAPPVRRGWWLVAAVVAAAAIVWGVTRPSAQPHRAAAPSATATVRPDPACRAVPDCFVRSGITPEIAALARAYLPRGMRLKVRTVVSVDSLSHRNLLVARDIDGDVDSVTVLIRLQRAGSAGSARREIAPDPPGLGSILISHVNSGFVVRLQYLAPETVPPTLGRLRELIRDPRLASI